MSSLHVDASNIFTTFFLHFHKRHYVCSKYLLDLMFCFHENTKQNKEIRCNQRVTQDNICIFLKCFIIKYILNGKCFCSG